MKTDKLKKLHACKEAIQWAEQQENQQQAWDDCERGDWMLWLIGRLSEKPRSTKRKKLVLASCECARLALPHVTVGEQRPLQAIETAEAWARNEGVSIEGVNKAYADAAYAATATTTAAADAAAYAAASSAASSAAYAAASSAASSVASSAADAAADAAVYAADAYAAASAKKEILKRCADIVRKHCPKVPKV